METICLKTLEKDPGARYATAKELAEDLRRFIEDLPIVARPLGPIGRAVKFMRRRRAATVAVLASVLLMVAAGVAISHARGFVDNFAMGTLRIEPGRTVDFVNTFDNLAGAGCEVLYVQTLSLGADSTIRLNGCYVYYDVLIKENYASVELQGGALMSIDAGDLDDDADADLSDSALLASYLVGGSCSTTCQSRADVNGDGAVNGADIPWMVRLLTGW